MFDTTQSCLFLPISVDQCAPTPKLINNVKQCEGEQMLSGYIHKVVSCCDDYFYGDFQVSKL